MVAALKFGFQFDGEPRKINKVPSREFPNRIRRAQPGFTWQMLKFHHDVHRVVARFDRGFFWLEIERPETAVAAPDSVKFWVQIEDALALQIYDAQVGIT